MCSNFGRLVNLGRILREDHSPYYKEPRLIKPNNNHSYNHLFLAIYTHGKRVAIRYVHRLVAELFIENPNKYNEVEHLDADATNNHYTNLRWCTRSMNRMNPISHQRWLDSMRGKERVNRRRPIVQLLNGVMIKQYTGCCETKKDRFSPNAVRQVCRGCNKTSGGYQWMFLSDYENLINKSKNSTSQTDNENSD